MRKLLLASLLLGSLHASPVHAQLVGTDTVPGSSCAGFPDGATRVTADADLNGADVVLVCDGTNWLIAPGGGGGSLDDLSDVETDYPRGSMYLGEDAGVESLVNEAFHSTGIGVSVLRYNEGESNTAIGEYALARPQASPYSSHNVGIGRQAGDFFAGANNVIIGSRAAEGGFSSDYYLGGSDNVFLGNQSARNVTGEANHRNVIIGSVTAASLRDGADNILLGYGTDVPTGTASGYLNIGNAITGSLDLTAPFDSSSISLAGSLALPSDVSPASIGGSQNDYAPTGHATASVLRLTAGAAYNITGLAGGADGRILRLVNIGTNNITLLNESASSLAANRFMLNGANAVLGTMDSVTLLYDSTSSRWRAIAFFDAGTSLSDIRLKTQITPLESASGLNAIIRINPIRFHWKDEAKDKAEGPQIGLSAQDVKAVLPHAVHEATEQIVVYGPDGQEVVEKPLAVDYEALIVPLVKAVQDLKAENDNLSTTVDELTRRLDQLEAKSE